MDTDVPVHGFAEQLDDIDAVHQAMDERRDSYMLQDVRPVGRPPGSRNKIRPGFREMTYEVLNSIEMGGLRGYIEWAMTHKTDFYSRLCPKLFGGEFTLALAQPFEGQPVTFILATPAKTIDLEDANLPMSTDPLTNSIPKAERN